MGADLLNMAGLPCPLVFKAPELYAAVNVNPHSFCNFFISIDKEGKRFISKMDILAYNFIR